MSDSSPFVDIPRMKNSIISTTANNTPSKRLSFTGDISRANISTASNHELEQLKIQVRTLTYELKDSKNTIEFNKVEHERTTDALIKQLKEQQEKYETVSSDQIYYYTETKKLKTRLSEQKDAFEKEKSGLTGQVQSLKRELHELKDSYEMLNDDYKEFTTRFVDLDNRANFDKSEANAKIESLESQLDSAYSLNNALKQENSAKDNELENLKVKISSLPNDLEIETNKSIQNQLAEQIQYINDLESKNLQQAEQIKKMNLNKQNVEILKDEKNSLLVKLSEVDKLQDEINYSNLENLNLKSQLTKWNVYLGEIEDIDAFFRNTKFLKDENLILTNNFEKISNDMKISQKQHDELFINYESLKKESSVVKDKYDNLLKINYELEQQKSLLVEESNFLREQLKNFDHELSINENEKDKYITNLENIISEYKTQLNELTQKHKSEFEERTSNKRQRVDNGDFTDDDTSRNFQTSIIKLKDELMKLNNEKTRLTNDNVILLKKIESFESINEQKVRILQLRNNPFQKDQIVKRSKLENLEKINNDLLKHQQNQFVEMIPKSIFEKSELDKTELETKINNLNKRIQRLREIFQSKSLEFIDAVQSLLGFKLEFLSSNKIKLISKYTKNPDNCIVIDPVNQTLKLNKSGSDDENEDIDFFKVYNNLISFWIKEKNEIPCFLSAMNLELFEKEQTSQN